MSELTAHMRSTRALVWFLKGNRGRIADIARLCEMDWDSAEYMLSNMSLEAQLAEDDLGYWYWSGPPIVLQTE